MSDPSYQNKPKCEFCKRDDRTIYKVYVEDKTKRFAPACIDCGRKIRRYIKFFEVEANIFTLFERMH